MVIMCTTKQKNVTLLNYFSYWWIWWEENSEIYVKEAVLNS